MPTYWEVTSGAEPYLPAADPASWHLPGASGRFDREFRLLREDTAGQIRDACHEVLQAVRGSGLDAYRRQHTSTHFDVCDDAKLQRIHMYRKGEIEFTVACKQPASTTTMTDEERRAWWVQCKRFRPGTAVCVLDTAGVILHFVVSKSTLRVPEDASNVFPVPFEFKLSRDNEWSFANLKLAADDIPMDKYKFNLSSGKEWSFVNLKLVESSQLGDALRWYSDTERSWYLLDFPHILLAPFKHTLEALQRQCQSPHRLISLLNTDSPYPRSRPVVERPAYTRAPGFAFKLDCLMQHEQTFEFDPMHPPTPAEVSSLADLKPDQATALLESLSREVALIDGRSGTGKSYLARKIVKAMVHNRDHADLGPTVCIFRDDAALDCMVDQLLDDGIERIVGMGGCSDSERVQSLNIPTSQHAGICGQERQAEEDMAMFLDKLVLDTNKGLLELSKIRFAGNFGAYPHESRQKHQEYIIELLTRSYKEYEETRAELPRFRDDVRRQALQNAQVVAVTTIELDRSPELLQTIHAKVLVCDDADQFLESQTLTAILPSTEHIILIGDHNQLPPKVQTEQRGNPEGVHNSSDVSLFHRLVDDAHHHCPRIPPSALNTTHNLCDQACGRSQPGCAHACQRTWHGDDSECGPCQQPCDIRCSHRTCDKLCHEPCLPCTEDHCTSGCPHSKCTMPCAAPCNWVPCSRRCTLLLDCGHQCPSLCGEACPDSKYCQTCGAEDILFTVVDGLGMKDYRDVDLDEDPCIFPHCGHLQTRSSMDQQLEMQDFYHLTEQGIPSSIKDVLQPFSVHKVMCCTQCRGSLRDVSRYGRITRRLLLDESLKEFLSWSRGRILTLTGRVAQRVSSLNLNIDHPHLPTYSNNNSLSIELNGHMQSQIHALGDFVGGRRYTYLADVYSHIRTFATELKAKEDVFRKLADLTKRANEANEAAAHSSGAAHLHEPLVQPCGDLIEKSLSMVCNIAILSDFVRLWMEQFPTPTSPVPTLRFSMMSNFRGSQHLIKRAQEIGLPLLEVQGHVQFAWFCGFARVMSLYTPAQGQELMATLAGQSAPSMPEFPVSREDLRTRGLEHISKAKDICKSFFETSKCLEDEIEDTETFVCSSLVGKVPGKYWYMCLIRDLSSTGPWYVCDKGHPFKDLRADSTLLEPLRCTDCDLVVAEHGNASEEGGASDVGASLPSQGELLVDI